MNAQTEPAQHVARKKHHCSWCGEFIEPGSTYKRYRYFNYGDAGTVKMHPECYGAMIEAAEDEGGWIEWTPGDGERPKSTEVA